jgi:coenzyme F420-0:L-glutamate ligase / coenzyme F420-1:gamma-L-glutamate ligase
MPQKEAIDLKMTPAPQFAARSLTLEAIAGLPLVQSGDDLPNLIAKALKDQSVDLRCGDILAVAQKIVSKAQGRMVSLDQVCPGQDALALAERTGKDAALVQLILDESSQIVTVGTNLIIAAHRLGHVMANAGIDQSNIDRERSVRGFSRNSA